MPHRRSSWGCVQRLDRDRYRIRYWADLGDGYRRHTMTVRGTRRDADARLAELRTKYERKPDEPVRRPKPHRTVGWYYDALWLPDAPEKMRRKTLINKRSSWRRYVAPRWEDVRVSDVRRADVQAWLRDDGLAMTHECARGALTLLRELLDLAVGAEEIERNPADGKMRLPRGGEEMDKTILHGDEEFDAYADAVRGTVAEAPFLLMAMGGCRVGESLSPRVSEVEEHTVDGVRLACVHVDCDVDDLGHIDELKNGHSARTVAVSGTYADRLIDIRDECERRGWDYLADDGTGSPVSTRVLRRVWYRSIAAAGLPKRLMRNLRPSFATSMHWDAEVPLDKLQAMMGHKPGSQVTLRHYDRPDDSAVLKARADAEARRT